MGDLWSMGWQIADSFRFKATTTEEASANIVHYGGVAEVVPPVAAPITQRSTQCQGIRYIKQAAIWLE